ncbi:hypothetical protein INR49_015089 [Caranx melampygus]|nr:hypothetical protein INR49_015089 [Caranx melampygus]
MSQWAGLQHWSRARTLASTCTNERGTSCFLWAGSQWPPPSVILVSTDEYEAEKPAAEDTDCADGLLQAIPSVSSDGRVDVVMKTGTAAEPVLKALLVSYCLRM